MAAFAGKVLSACAAACAMAPQGVAGKRLRSASSSGNEVLSASWWARPSEGDRSATLLDFAHANMTHSNLGGLGPDHGEDCITIHQAGMSDGTGVTMKLRVAEGYDYDGIVTENKLHGGLLYINVLNGYETKLDVELLDHTGARKTLPRFFMSILDIDAGSILGDGLDPSYAAGLEIVSFTNVSAYYMEEDARIYVKHADSQGIIITANQSGSAADNPTSPWNLNQEQLGKAVMVEFHHMSNFSMGLTVLNQQGHNGRNFLVTGISDMINSPFGFCDDAAYFAIGDATVTWNNLDGSIWGRTQRITYENAGVIHGTNVDLWVDFVGGQYNPTAPTSNGLHGHLGNINMGVEDSATFSFTFVLSGTNEPVALTDFFFSFYDIDQNEGGSESLTLTSAVGTYFLSEGTTLQTTANDDGSVTFMSSAVGSDSNNPRVAGGADIDEAVTLYFQSPISSFDITYTTVANAGRNFQFGSMAGIACP